MRLFEREINLPAHQGNLSLLSYFEQAIGEHLPSAEIPVRFVVTRSDADGYLCELGVLAGTDAFPIQRPASIFDFSPRKVENTEKFNVVLLVPTGIGAEIGGHAGDACPVARLLASACDTLITHPNVVNASDINEMPENGLYVEGSVIAQLMMGTIGLQKVRANRVILVIDDHPTDSDISDFAVNAASAARASLGLDCPTVVKMSPQIKMRVDYSTSGSAVGQIEYLERIYEVLSRHKSEFDAVAISSIISVPEDYHLKYFTEAGKMINPWGGVEAMLTHAVTMFFGVPSAHSPMVEKMEIANLITGVVDPRMSAEAISTAFLHCILKGLHRSPRIVKDPSAFNHPGVISVADISCLVIPDGCIGLPTLAALEQGIPVIAVTENRNLMRNDLSRLAFAPGKFFVAENYLEAAGIMAALKSGVAPAAVRRPLAYTRVISENSEQAELKARTA